MKDIRNVLWGLVLIVIGLILGLNALDIVDIDLFFDGWWTLFIIVPCFVDLFGNGSKTGNLIGIMIGVILLLAAQDLVDFEIIWKLAFPAVFILIGLSFVFKNAFASKVNDKIKEINSEIHENKEFNAVFSSQRLNYNEEKFEGVTLNAVFGGVDVQLKDAKIKKDCVITATSIFGGIDIIVPDDVNVVVTSTSIFGGVSNKVRNKSENKVTVYLNATCLFGGVDIR